MSEYNPEEVTDTILQRVNLEFTPGLQTQFLYQLVKQNNYKQIKRILKQKKTKLNFDALASLLWFSIPKKFNKIVKILLQHGADVNQCCINYSKFDPRVSLMTWAIFWKNTEAAKMLMAFGINVVDPDFLGVHFLFFAVVTNNLEIAIELVKYGIKIENQNKNKNSVLHLAAATGYPKLVEFLGLYKPDVNSVNMWGQNALHFAVENLPWYGDVIRILIEFGVPVNGLDCENETPLHYALSLNKERKAIELLKNGADVNAVSKNGVFPLFIAIAGKCSNEIVQLLLKNGANVNQRIYNGETNLHYACKHELTTIISELLKFGADINLTDTNGNVPLACIINKGSRAAKILINHIVELKIRNFFVSEMNFEIISRSKILGRFYAESICSKDLRMMIPY